MIRRPRPPRAVYALVLIVFCLAGLSCRGAAEVTVGELIAGRGTYEGRTVGLVLQHGFRLPNDPVAPLITRSDDYLHDQSGTIVLVSGWQAWMRWQEQGSYSSPWLTIDRGGTWRLRAQVCYTADGLPYLRPPS